MQGTGGAQSQHRMHSSTTEGVGGEADTPTTANFARDAKLAPMNWWRTTEKHCVTDNSVKANCMDCRFSKGLCALCIRPNCQAGSPHVPHMDTKDNMVLF